MTATTPPGHYTNLLAYIFAMRNASMSDDPCWNVRVMHSAATGLGDFYEDVSGEVCQDPDHDNGNASGHETAERRCSCVEIEPGRN